MTNDPTLARAMRGTADPPMLPLPDRAAELVSALSCPPRLAAHLRAVHDAAHRLVGRLEEHCPGLDFDREAVLFGAATHDVGKTVHVAASQVRRCHRIPVIRGPRRRAAGRPRTFTHTLGPAGAGQNPAGRLAGAQRQREFYMSDAHDWNAQIIAEFRANEGRVGGVFEGAPLVLLHHLGRKSRQEYVTPVMYLPHEADPGVVYVFASKAGAPTNPEWYHNLVAAGDGSVERGTDAYRVTVRELPGAERDRVYAEQARRYPGFAEYARQTAGVRTIPVLELSRA
ncbi:nitroreductase family deazaflavin-dependent oxidoreductase [Streptomyces sp. NPDC020917]|uniref:nitroreductase family deazaflavin-dependent oxidoreductase n=1 Tax=Streptomyces sp. NPDC020917 TaxID=3365102 RepID=UPI0037BDFE30